MKHKRISRIFCAVLAAVMVLGNGNVVHAETGTRKYAVPGTNALLTYTFDTSDNTATITGSQNVTGDFVIPSVLDGTYTVTEIGGAFYGNDDLTSVVVPDTVTKLRDTFEGCKNLTSVTLPEGLKEINVACFERCGLTSITIPDSVTTLGSYVFENCDELTSIVLPGTIQDFGISIFMLCDNLEHVTIENGVTEITDSEFSNCEKLESVSIPESVTAIQDGAFGDCKSLNHVTLPSGLQKIGNNAFERCSSLTEITIPAGITSLVSEVFWSCPALKSVTLPKEMTRISYDVFKYCDAITDVYYTGTEAQSKLMTIEAGNDPLYYANWHYLDLVSFTDVPAGTYFYNPVYWAVKNNITTGTSSTTFSPSEDCTRSQAVTFLWRALGQPAAAGATFSDVEAGSYYADAVAWAVKNSITAGTGSGGFSPNLKCTRAQIVTFLWRAAGSPKVTGAASFSDVAAGSYYSDAVAWAVGAGITSGTGSGMFSPDENCSRAQVVTFLSRYLNK